MDKLKILIASDGEKTFVLFNDRFLETERVSFSSEYGSADITFGGMGVHGEGLTKEFFCQLVSECLGYEIRDV